MFSLLQGAYDLHVHTGPDVNKRKLDDIEMAQRYIQVGVKGYCIKSHYFCSAERARLIQKLYPNFNPIGAICLNHASGGINPHAVEMAARDGAKIVFMPTFDAKNEIGYTFSDACTYKVMPAWAKVMLEHKEAGKEIEGLTVFDGGGISAKAKEVLDIIARSNMILCTGHLGKEETVALLKEAPKHNLKKFVVTHPTFSSTLFTKEEQKELTGMGAVLEQCYGVVSPSYGIDWEGMYQVIRYVGPKHCIMSSDCGNINKPYPDEGLLTFANNLLENGFTNEEVRRMSVINTAALVEG